MNIFLTSNPSHIFRTLQQLPLALISPLKYERILYYYF